MAAARMEHAVSGCVVIFLDKRPDTGHTGGSLRSSALDQLGPSNGVNGDCLLRKCDDVRGNDQAFDG
jgi:hypothetical protein